MRLCNRDRRLCRDYHGPFPTEHQIVNPDNLGPDVVDKGFRPSDTCVMLAGL